MRVGAAKGNPDIPTAAAAAAWRPVGTILGGGTVSSLAVSPHYWRDRKIVAGTAAGVYASSDEGHTWSPLGAGATSPLNVQGVAFSPSFQRDELLVCGGLGGFMRSADAGRHWFPPDMWPGSQSVSALAISPNYADDSTLLLGTQDEGVYVSTNGGRIWSTANFGLDDLLVLAVAFSPVFGTDETAFLVAGDGVYRTTNAGRAWRAVGVGRGLDSEAAQVIALSPNYARDRTVFVGTEDAGIFRSRDRGSSWEAAGEELTGLSINAIHIIPAAGTGNGAANCTLYAGSGEGMVYRSMDGGDTWECLADGLPPVLTFASVPGSEAAAHQAQGSPGRGSATVGPGPVLLIGCHRGGVYRSADGGRTWEPSSHGLAARPVLHFALSPQFPGDRRVFAGGLEDGVLRSSDAGRTWEPANEGLASWQVHALAISPSFGRDGVLFAATPEGVFRSADGAGTWQACGPLGEAEAGDVRGLGVSPDLAEDGCVAAFDAKGRLYLSRDGGATWVPVEADLEGADVVAAAFSPRFSRDHTLLVGAARQAAPGRPASLSVWRSSDSGSRWAKMWEAQHTGRWMVLAVPPGYRGNDEYNDRFFMAAGNTVYRPMWRVKRQWYGEKLGGTRNAVLALAVSPLYESDRTIFAGTTDGVFISRDEGLTWRQVSDGLTNRAVAALAPSPAHADDGCLYALTLGGTVWQLAGS